MREALGKFDHSISFPQEVEDEELVKTLINVGEITPIAMHDYLYGKDIQFKAPQNLAYWFAMKHRKFILSFDKGMGKTVTYLKIAQDSGAEKILILCGQNAMPTQRSHIRRFFPQWANSFAFIRGNRAQREKLWNDMHLQVYICTYQTFLADMGSRAGSGGRIVPKWVDNCPFLIADEYHRVLRNKNSKFHNMFKKIFPQWTILSSGSAANKGPHSMWTALNVLAPKFFTSYWKYVGAFCVVDDTPFGKRIVGVQNVPGWRNAIGPYVFHRKKNSKDYPPKTRQLLEVEMEPWQQRIHDDLKEKLLTILDSGNLVLVKNTLEATIRIRQMMVCPKFLDSSLGYGAGLEAILADATESELTHFVVSTPFTGPIPLMKQFFKEHGFENVQSLQGGMGPDEIDEAIAKWTRDGGPIIQSINFAESYELPAARIMYMLGYEHDPERDIQAEDRIHRDIHVTPDPVDIYYVKHLGSYDEKILEALVMHSDNVHELMNRPIKEVFNL